MRKLTLRLCLTDDRGQVHGEMAIDLGDEVAFMGERIADDFRFEASIGSMSMNDAVKVLNVKQVRKKLLALAARNLGESLAEHLEDREGWHGVDRQERVNEEYAPPRWPVSWRDA
jgi:hypothetical protein